MNEVLEYLKSAGILYSATSEEKGQPRVRTLGLPRLVLSPVNRK